MYKHLKQSREQIQSSETRAAGRKQRMSDQAAMVVSESRKLLETFVEIHNRSAEGPDTEALLPVYILTVILFKIN